MSPSFLLDKPESSDGVDGRLEEVVGMGEWGGCKGYSSRISRGDLSARIGLMSFEEGK
jgi:hypothetical protein